MGTAVSVGDHPAATVLREGTANEGASRSIKAVPYAAVLSARSRPPATQILFGNGEIRVSLDAGGKVAVTSASIATQAPGVAEPHQCPDSNRAVRTRRGPVCSPDHTPTSFILRYQEARRSIVRFRMPRWRTTCRQSRNPGAFRRVYHKEYEVVADFPLALRGGGRADGAQARAGQEGRRAQERRARRGGALQVAGGDAHRRGQPQLHPRAGAGGGRTQGRATGGQGGVRGRARPADRHRSVRDGGLQVRGGTD